jgi:hypothetical protein
MRRMRLKAPSPALVVSLVALFVALGGGSYALAAATIGTAQLKNKAVTNAKLAPNSVGTAKIRSGAVTASQINPSGLSVPFASNAGSAQPAAFAQVNVLGALNGSNSRNVGSVTRVGNSVYCLSGIPFTVRGGQVTVDFNNSARQFGQFGLGSGPGCPAGTQGFVFTTTNTTDSPAGFFVMIYG